MAREDARVEGTRTPLPVHSRSPWAAGRALSLAGLAAVALGLVLRPEATAALFWWGIIPVLPLVFLIHPALWRNVCPLATISMGRPGEALRPGSATDPSPWAGAAGVLPLLLLVGWRATGLESRPVETGALLAGVVGVAVVAGRRGIRRSGFCNRLCPLLPVERLYGSRPLADVPDDRCPSCSLCTPRGCLDLSATAAAAQLLGPRRRGPDWLLTPFGAFAAAFPGFVAAYFWPPHPPDPAVADLAGRLALGLAISWTLTSLVVRIGRISWRHALPTLAASAAGLYYGFAAPRAVAAFSGPPGLGRTLQALLVAFVIAWWVRAIVRIDGSPRIAGPGPRGTPGSRGDRTG